MHHPDLAARARWLPHGISRESSVPWLRRLYRLMGALLGWGWRRVSLGEAAVYVSPSEPSGDGPHPALLWIHGGGLMVGDARQQAPYVRALGASLGAFTISVDYRLAPEHPFPTGLDDVEAAYRWLAAQPGVDPDRITVAGASAGGHLAAALCQRLRDEGGPMPRVQGLVYPMLDDQTGPPDARDAGFRMWDREANRLGWQSWLRGLDRDHPPAHAVPARTEDLSGLPPAWIGVGTLDLFHDEDVAYARRLEAAGVPVTLEVVDGAYHAFDALDQGAACSRAFRASLQATLRRHLVASAG